MNFVEKRKTGPTNFRLLYCDSVGKQRSVPVFLEKYFRGQPLFLSVFEPKGNHDASSNHMIDSYDLIKSILLILVDDIGCLPRVCCGTLLSIDVSRPTRIYADVSSKLNWTRREWKRTEFSVQRTYRFSKIVK